jgi:hypothetical protein
MIAFSPDGRYPALLNEGYATKESGVRQSIAVLNLRSNQLRDFPDDRLRGDEKTTRRSYFVGLAFSSDGKHPYASMGSATENGIVVYKFSGGEVAAERFITIPRRGSDVIKRLHSIVAGARLEPRSLILSASLF